MGNSLALAQALNLEFQVLKCGEASGGGLTVCLPHPTFRSNGEKVALLYLSGFGDSVFKP